jgi:hypothetical protein
VAAKLVVALSTTLSPPPAVVVVLTHVQCLAPLPLLLLLLQNALPMAGE